MIGPIGSSGSPEWTMWNAARYSSHSSNIQLISRSSFWHIQHKSLPQRRALPFGEWFYHLTAIANANLTGSQPKSLTAAGGMVSGGASVATL